MIILGLLWKITYLILAKHLLFSKNHFFCFQKWKILGAPSQVEFTIFYLFIFFWTFARVLLNDINKSVCGKFFIVLQLEDIKENWKRSGPTISGAIIVKGLWWCPSAIHVEEIRLVSFSIIAKTSLKKLLYLIISFIQSGQRGVIPTFLTPTFFKCCSSSSKLHSWNAA